MIRSSSISDAEMIHKAVITGKLDNSRWWKLRFATHSSYFAIVIQKKKSFQNLDHASAKLEFFGLGL